MLATTDSILLRAVKYGETSLVATFFTQEFGVQSYLLRGVRGKQKTGFRAVLLHPGSLLRISTDHKPNHNLQRLRDWEPAYVSAAAQQDILRHSVTLFSVELLLRLLPEQSPQEELFAFSFEYFRKIDQCERSDLGNFPLFFLIRVSDFLGYGLSGRYSAETPFLDPETGMFVPQDSESSLALMDEISSKALSDLRFATSYEEIAAVKLSSALRVYLLDWHLDFLQHHTQYLTNLKSLEVLRSIFS